jgi:hypothetical protein
MIYVSCYFADEFFVSQTATKNSLHAEHETRHVGALDAGLQETPEVLHTVCVDVHADIFSLSNILLPSQ